MGSILLGARQTSSRMQMANMLNEVAQVSDDSHRALLAILATLQEGVPPLANRSRQYFLLLDQVICHYPNAPHGDASQQGSSAEDSSAAGQSTPPAELVGVLKMSLSQLGALATARLPAHVSSGGHRRLPARASAPSPCLSSTAPILVTYAPWQGGRRPRGNARGHSHRASLTYASRPCAP